MSACTHLVTGGTGLVGAALILELLDTTTDEIVGVVRGRDPVEARTRLILALSCAAKEYGRADLIPDIAERVQASPGNIAEPLCGLDRRHLPRITHLWHSAASLRYEDSHAAEIHALNVIGTENVVDLAHALGRPALNYVSTCYVAGRRTGVQHETVVNAVEQVNNLYEASKIRAESLVVGSRLPWRIIRPSVVVGHSGSSAVTTFSGLYGFASTLRKFRQTLANTVGEALNEQELLFLADPDAELNLAPVDLVARNGVRCGLYGPPHTVFHLANAQSPTMRQVFDIVFPWAGLPVPVIVDDRDAMSPTDRRLDNLMSFYGAYFRHPKRFDMTNTSRIVGTVNTASTMGPQRVADLLDWYQRRIQADGRELFPARTSFAYSSAA